MRKLKLDRNKKYLIAVSGGPDSMALLDMAFNCGVYIEAAHVNYHKRKTADRDEKIIRSYCRRHEIPLHIANFKDETKSGNFQAMARDFRYAFFAKTMKKYGLDEVLVAHQLDDLVETYLMQKEKKIGVAYYGLRKNNTVNGAIIMRPLLGYEKKELQKYCDDNDIAYGIDESNLGDDYTRNRIRHEQVEKLTKKEKQEIAKEALRLNREKEKQFKIVKRDLLNKKLSVSEVCEHPYLDVFLRHYYSQCSGKTITEMIRQLQEAGRCLFTGDTVTIVKEYDYIEIFENVEAYAYYFAAYEDISFIKYPYFRLRSQGDDLHGVTLREDDFPICIRSAKKGDRIRLRFGTKKISRFFIDRKIGYRQRLSWPVVINQKGEVVLVPGIGSDLRHYSEKHNLFVIEL